MIENLEVTSPDQVEDVRRQYSNFFNAFYTGWSDDFDRCFDVNSDWYVGRDSASFCRVTFRRPGGALPIESAGFELDDTDSLICEVNNFYHRQGREENGIALLDAVLATLRETPVRKIYCVVDKSFMNGKAYRLNTERYGFTDVQQTKCFVGIQHKNSLAPVAWSLLVKKL